MASLPEAVAVVQADQVRVLAALVAAVLVMVVVVQQILEAEAAVEIIIHPQLVVLEALVLLQLNGTPVLCIRI